MSHSISCSWNEGMSFDAKVSGHTITMDADQSSGGEDRGARPKPMLLASLAGCTGMDVITILKKMGQEPSFFNIKVEGALNDEHPKHYQHIKLVYEFKEDDGLDVKKVQRAVQLSQEKYCGVSAMLRQAAELDYEIRYL
jgi:putative redox protein